MSKLSGDGLWFEKVPVSFWDEINASCFSLKLSMYSLVESPLIAFLLGLFFGFRRSGFINEPLAELSLD